MIGLLADNNIEGHARLLWRQFAEADWQSMGVSHLVTLGNLQIAVETSDRDIWLFCQSEDLLLLTANRNMDGVDSLEAVLREQAIDQPLPVLTLADPDRVLIDPVYRELCAYRIADIALDLDQYRGTPRAFIP
jgi:hypothetical protein